MEAVLAAPAVPLAVLTAAGDSRLPDDDEALLQITEIRKRRTKRLAASQPEGTMNGEATGRKAPWNDS